MRAVMSPRLRLLHYLISRSGKEFVAHCLDLDIVTSGPTQKESIDRLDQLVAFYVQSALYAGNDMALSTTAPREYWEKFQKAKPLRPSRKIIELKIPEQPIPLKNSVSEIGVLLAKTA